MFHLLGKISKKEEKAQCSHRFTLRDLLKSKQLLSIRKARLQEENFWESQGPL